ncbi:MAG: DUF2958 domain-containing protein [Campylobacterota bacterium]|nr:DUF2958 domain-containing protein [Campylobacterota bacterium]
MPLLTSKDIEQLPTLYSSENEKDPLCHIKLFTPDSSFTWFIIEVDDKDRVTCFGYVVGLESELGYFNLDEIERVRGPLGLKVERDRGFTPTRLSELKK